MEQKLTIPSQELTADTREYFWHLDGEFFSEMGSVEVLDADLDVLAKVSDDGSLTAECSVKGKVTVECDRCLDPLDLPVVLDFVLEDLEADACLDLRQDVYDYVCTSLPMQRVHPEGGCNPDAVKYLAG